MVDDEAFARLFAVQILFDEGFVVVEAEDAAEAVEQLAHTCLQERAEEVDLCSPCDTVVTTAVELRHLLNCLPQMLWVNRGAVQSQALRHAG